MTHFWLMFLIISFVYGYPIWCIILIFACVMISMYQDCFTE